MDPTTAALPQPATLPNPLVVRVADREYLWNQLVDTIDDYFDIAREERIQLVGDVLTEGRIDTWPQVGATVFERWRRDSTPGYERWQSTLQSIRRRAEVRVQPSAGGWSVQVVVYKELEDLDRPEHATVGRTLRRHDGSLVRLREGRGGQPVTLGWIPLGRDVLLEQAILAQIAARFHDALPTPRVQTVY